MIQDWTSILNISLNIGIIIIILSTIIVIILENRHPVKTLAWVMVLMFLPIVGIIFYFFFGQSFRRERLISKRSYWNIARKPLRGYWRKAPETLPEESRTLINLFRRMNRSMPFGGNQIEIYTNGYQMLHALLKAISYAQHHIHLEYYIFENDAVGYLVSDALIDKARKGVKVRILYDDVGNWRVPNKFYKRMQEEGIEIHPFFEVRFPIFSNKVNYRNHRKLAIIDGRIGIIGGMNLAKRYLNGLSWGEWRDTSIQIYGQAIQTLQTVFLTDWCFVTNEQITEQSYFPNIDSQGKSLIQIVTSKPIGRWREIMQGYLWSICNARKYIYIQTPYFLPTEQLLAALQTAALVGIDVRIMLPWKGDNRITQMCSRSFLRDMMEAGVKIYFYHHGFLHAKTMVIDDNISTVGSANFDFRSFEHNFEANAFMYDRETAIRLKNIFLNDQKLCAHISSQRWAKRSLWRKFEESLLRLLAPLL